MTNNHYNEPAFPDEKNNGLTKLEYAAIHIYAGCLTHTDISKEPADSQIERQKCIYATLIAKQLLTELNKETNAND